MTKIGIRFGKEIYLLEQEIFTKRLFFFPFLLLGLLSLSLYLYLCYYSYCDVSDFCVKVFKTASVEKNKKTSLRLFIFKEKILDGHRCRYSRF